ncbi:DMT family transporter [Undibacterium sp. Jales W-56]|uniref:DMT family transporter n=1 Tax=Undibacterium sp. Jales W-56 TaxID=2897325 RepID=UPI0021D338C6|nr:DMT family transporter [Undibacterium sp. Jales W-56]MCU6434170.1 DMT family transporter [Undibacterium sp. Jales W-56]
MLSGVLAALGAGLLWGLVFITPLILPDYPGVILSFGRYVAFGVIALIPAWFDRQRIAQLRRQDWLAAGKLALVGNLIYYSALASAIQLADAPLPTMLIGTLPVVIAICSNWSPLYPGDSIAWNKLALPLLIILAGLLLVNASEMAHFTKDNSSGQRSIAEYVKGGLIALVAVAAWTWYPIMNSRYMKVYTHISSSTWATAQGLATLPLALIGYLGYGLFAQLKRGSADAGSVVAFHFPLGSTPLKFIVAMAVLGLLASWLGTLLWNLASQKLPTSLAGQLIVFETLSALLYAFILRGSLPAPQILIGVVLLCAGVTLAVRAFQPVPH